MDSDYPRDIHVGFKNIPNDIDAAFALPANNYQGKERAYFFKGTFDFLPGKGMFCYKIQTKS